MGLALMSLTTPGTAKNLLNADLTGEDDGDEILDGMHADAPELAPITLHLTPAVCGVRLDKALSSLVTQYSRSRMQQWIEGGHVMVDGVVARAKMTAFGDETVVITPQAAPEDEAFRPEAMALDIVHGRAPCSMACCITIRP
jgi:23S rRNA pseudouridine1911/1915/1917 synthase